MDNQAVWILVVLIVILILIGVFWWCNNNYRNRKNCKNNQLICCEKGDQGEQGLKGDPGTPGTNPFSSFAMKAFFVDEEDPEADIVWVLPSNSNTNTLVIEMWGGGGGGGQATQTTANGGGAGGYLKATVKVTPGDIFTIHVGQKGAVDTDGVDTTVVQTNGTSLIARKGLKGGLGTGAFTDGGDSDVLVKKNVLSFVKSKGGSGNGAQNGDPHGGHAAFGGSGGLTSQDNLFPNSTPGQLPGGGGGGTNGSAFVASEGANGLVLFYLPTRNIG